MRPELLKLSLIRLRTGLLLTDCMRKLITTLDKRRIKRLCFFVFIFLLDGALVQENHFYHLFNVHEAPKIVKPEVRLYHNQKLLVFQALFMNSCLAETGSEIFEVSRLVPDYEKDTRTSYLIVSLKPKKESCPEIYQPVLQTYLVQLSNLDLDYIQRLEFINEIYLDDQLGEPFQNYRLFLENSKKAIRVDKNHIVTNVTIY